jgi:hypothetical protein
LLILICFVGFFKKPLLLKFCEDGKQLWIEAIVVVPHFGSILELRWLVLCTLSHHMVVVRRNAFSAFPNA